MILGIVVCELGVKCCGYVVTFAASCAFCILTRCLTGCQASSISIAHAVFLCTRCFVSMMLFWSFDMMAHILYQHANTTRQMCLIIWLICSLTVCILDSDHAHPEHRRVQHGRKFCHTHIAAASSAALQSHRSAMAAAILLWFCLHQICSVQLSPCCFWFGFTIALDSVCASQVHLHMRLMICDKYRCRWLSSVSS